MLGARGLTVLAVWIVVLMGLFPSLAKGQQTELRLLATILPVHTFTLNVVGNAPGVRWSYCCHPPWAAPMIMICLRGR